MMADDDIRLEPQRFDLVGGALHCLRPRHRQFEFPRMRMDQLFGTAGDLVDDAAHAGNEIGVLFADEHHVMLIGRLQVPDNMKKLSGEVLVDKQIFHEKLCSRNEAVLSP